MSPPRLAAAFVLLAAAPASPSEPAPPPREVRFDLVGDPLPPGAISRLGTTRFRVRGWHQQVFLSADGNTAIAKGEQGVLRAFDVHTGQVAWEVKDPDLWDWHADQSADGRYLAVIGVDRSAGGRGMALRLYDLATRQAVWTSRITDPDRALSRKVRFTPDGKRLVTAAQDVRVWDAKTGDELIRQKVLVGYGSLAVSPDGKTIAVAYYQLYLWDWESGSAPRKVETDERGQLGGLRFSADGKAVWAGDKEIDVATGKPTGRRPVGWPARGTFRPDGRAYAVATSERTGSREGYVSVREADTSKEIARLPFADDVVRHECWSRDGSRFAAISDNRVWVWDAKTGKPLGPDVPGHGAMIGGLAFAPDGRVFTASDDHTVRAWDANTGKELLRLTADGWVRGLAVSPDGSLVAGSAVGGSSIHGDFRVWDARTGKEVFRLLGHGRHGGERRVRFSADEQTLLSYGDDWYLRAFDTLTGKLKAEHRYRPKSPFAKGGDEDEENDRLIMFTRRAVDLGPDGNTCVMSDGKEVVVYAADTGKERVRFEADPSYVEVLALSADGRRLAIWGPGVAPAKPKPGQDPARPKDYQMTVWDLAEAKPVVKFRVPGSSFAGLLTFTPDGRRVVTATQEPILRFWDAQTGAAAGTVELPERPARVAFDAGMKRMAVSFYDSTALVYDLAAVVK